MQGTFVSTGHVFVQQEMQEAARDMLDRGTVSFDPAVMQGRAVPPQLRMLFLGVTVYRDHSRSAETSESQQNMNQQHASDACSSVCSCLTSIYNCICQELTSPRDV
jgi:hypothetical protein